MVWHCADTEFKPESNNSIDWQLYRNEYTRTKKMQKGRWMISSFWRRERTFSGTWSFYILIWTWAPLQMRARLEKTKEIELCWVSPSTASPPTHTECFAVQLHRAASKHTPILVDTTKALKIFLLIQTEFFFLLSGNISSLDFPIFHHQVT